MNIVVCAIVKTIGLLVGIVLLACCMAGCMYWVLQNFSFLDIMKFLCWVWLFCFLAFTLCLYFFRMYESCKESNQKKTATNVNQTVKNTIPVKSNIEPVTYSTHSTYSEQKTTSTQFDEEPTKQYPVLREIQNIISNLSELEIDNDLDKNMFTNFHKLKEQFDEDYQKTIKILTKLDKFKSINERHLRVFNHYLDLFKEEKDCIYKQIEQNYDNEIDAIYKNLDNIND